MHTVNSLSTKATGLPISIQIDVVKFLHQLPSANPKVLQVVAALLNATETLVALPEFQEMKEEDEAEQHCVRCHDTFTNNENGPSSCTIPHLFDTMPSHITAHGGYVKISGYGSRCCGPDVEVEEEGVGANRFTNLDELDQCYEGYHTMDVGEVEAEEEYNEINIRRCKMDSDSGECVQECIVDKDPVFDKSLQ